MNNELVKEIAELLEGGKLKDILDILEDGRALSEMGIHDTCAVEEAHDVVTQLIEDGYREIDEVF